MRASTLATFELVTTLPMTRSPGWTVVSLTATSRIRGAASGAKRGIFFATGASGAADGLPDCDGDASAPVAGVGRVATAAGARGDAGAALGPAGAGLACVLPTDCGCRGL